MKVYLSITMDGRRAKAATAHRVDPELWDACPYDSMVTEPKKGSDHNGKTWFSNRITLQHLVNIRAVFKGRNKVKEHTLFIAC